MRDKGMVKKAVQASARRAQFILTPAEGLGTNGVRSGMHMFYTNGGSGSALQPTAHSLQPTAFLLLFAFLTMNIWPGQPYPLGATWDGAGVNFALFSESATRVELCLFDNPDENQMVGR